MYLQTATSIPADRIAQRLWSNDAITDSRNTKQ